jgi:hypothetical protein
MQLNYSLNLRGSGWLIMLVLPRTLSIIWGAFDMHWRFQRWLHSGFQVNGWNNADTLFITFLLLLWSSGQRSWLQTQRTRVRFPALPDFFWEVVGLERGPLSLVRITEELFQGNSGSGLENRKLTTMGESFRWTRDTLYPLKLALTSPTSGGRSVGRYSSLADSSHGV